MLGHLAVRDEEDPDLYCLVKVLDFIEAMVDV